MSGRCVCAWVALLSVFISGCHCMQGERREGVDVVAVGFSSDPRGPALARLRQWDTDIGVHGEVWYYEVGSLWASIEPDAKALRLDPDPKVIEEYYTQPPYECAEPVEIEVSGSHSTLAVHSMHAIHMSGSGYARASVDANTSDRTSFIDVRVRRGQKELWIYPGPEGGQREDLTEAITDALGVDEMPELLGSVALATSPSFSHVAGIIELAPDKHSPEKPRFLFIRLEQTPGHPLNVTEAAIFDGPEFGGQLELTTRSDGTSLLGISHSRTKEGAGIELWELSNAGEASPVMAANGVVSKSLQLFSAEGRWGFATDDELVLLGEGSTPEARRTLERGAGEVVPPRAFRAASSPDGGLWMLTSAPETLREAWRGWCNGGIKGKYGAKVCLERLDTDLNTVEEKCESIDAASLPPFTEKMRPRYNARCSDYRSFTGR